MKAAIVRQSTGDGPACPGQQDALERVVLVDADDRVQGEGDKLDAHRLGQLHRAFSIFIFNARGEVLLQRRADAKYHFAGRWSNSCCGHPRPGEPTARAAVRRLGEELGFQTPLSEQMQLVYRAQDPESGLIEHEYLHVFRGRYMDDPRPDPAEVGAWRWTSVGAVRRGLVKSPHLFTPWFQLIVERVLDAAAAE
ncbi:isopentenyl-diphosphate delta-isomerase (plasmid) [Candidatus Thiodictyon syntrophicum]|uniref:Isopentenyl-diphosphate Delta-isomerase n=1 Tax=Candidatus Thiodictyon syntrophicum TaxID=1166950 RepID=A0A2K8UIH9_9GAMM|nr:isopentenyl-diphosphate Delta-isomerase [Candidatus Thiodictyon syntrophicum]AUB85383.1 isopentenyl-diphosphate delta-isomerase [Candidatus Thiodictyon syntrophicum]